MRRALPGNVEFRELGSARKDGLSAGLSGFDEFVWQPMSNENPKARLMAFLTTDIGATTPWPSKSWPALLTLTEEAASFNGVKKAKEASSSRRT